MKESACILHELARALSDRDELKAVWLDAGQKKVSFACGRGCDEDQARAAIQELVADLKPADLPDCDAGHPTTGSCAHCQRSGNRAMPPGIRLVEMPGSGYLIEKESCPTAQRLWRWQHFPWVRIKPVDLSVAELHTWRVPMALALACGVLTLAGFILEPADGATLAPLALACYILAYVCGAYEAATDVWQLLKKRTLDIHFLMLAVAFGAASIGHWWEGGVLLFLFSISGAMEDFAMMRTKREIDSLFKEQPKEAVLLDSNGAESRIPVDRIAPGMLLRIRPGESFPADGLVRDGASAADEAVLTGESVPVDKAPGDKVLAGTLNLWGRLDMEVNAAPRESALSKVIRLIQEARESKAPSQRFTDRFGSGYTYAILAASLAMFLVWWLALALPMETAFYRTMTLLVVASPCALVLSIPSAILAGIAAGARRGVLFRGGAAIEQLAEVRRVALDKTGTLTTGHLVVTGLESFPPGRERDVLALAAALDQHASHPIAHAIVRAAREQRLPLPEVRDFRSHTGLGVTGKASSSPAGDATVRMGRRTFLYDAPWIGHLPSPAIGETEVVLEAGDLRGRLLLRDEIRRTGARLLAQLRKEGLQLTMLSGDREESARHVSDALGLGDFRAGLSPEQKVEQIRAWSRAGERVAMVGDGVNDAPSLAAADVGVAMGLRGSDAALEEADVVLMKDRIERFHTAYLLSRRSRRIIRQNLAVSLGAIVVLVAAAFAGVIPLTVGVIGHEGSTVIVVMNSLRLLWMGHDQEEPIA
jgi:Cd2+/Zn2+-exporting ATPase